MLLHHHLALCALTIASPTLKDTCIGSVASLKHDSTNNTAEILLNSLVLPDSHRTVQAYLQMVPSVQRWPLCGLNGTGMPFHHLN